MSDGTRLTQKQLEILSAVMRGDDDGGFADLDQVMERLSYAPTKDALQFSMRFLVKRKLVEKKGLQIRRGRKRVLYDLTSLSRRMYDRTYDSFDIIEE